ncbi:hypothetical protein DU475_20990 [Rhodopseudomonas sp. WA056]|nr:hypothetical protein [Rhodopseudomonas sp. WA056]
MHGLALLFLLSIIACAATSAQAQLQSIPLLGDWQQIAGSAGNCPACRINLSGTGDDITVIANNGWSAQVRERRLNGAPVAVGYGLWRVRDSRFDGKQFDLVLELRGERLHMTMRIDAGRRAWVVRAVYGRPWLGS